MKPNIILYFLVSVFLLSSCSPYISTTIAKQVPPVSHAVPVEMFNFFRDLPPNASYLGNVFVGDRGTTTNCGYDTMLNLLKLEARKMGGNAVLVKNHMKPGFQSSCHQFEAEVYSANFSKEQISGFVIDDTLARITSDTLPNAVSADTKPESANNDVIAIQKAGLGYKFSLAGEPLSSTQLEILLRKNPEAFKLFNSVGNSIVPLSILSYIGGYCLGYGLTHAILKDPNTGLTIAGVGAGFMLITVPIVSSAQKKIKKSIDVYNMGIQGTSNTSPYRIDFGSTKNGAGILLTF